LLTGSESEIIYEPIPADDPKLRQPDISIAQELLDWYPDTSREKGLTETINYFRRILGD
jgi:nucleoside-diphosphate-sugar epimerase